MDDPISVVDINIRKKILKRGFKEMLVNKTRILCTHALDFLQHADKIVVLKKGQIVT
jgi:ATP-binding cassette, subfamily C (CFTR/MRP), member 1